MKNKTLCNDSDIGYCDPEWNEIREKVSIEIIKELEIINSEIKELDEKES